jgi:hypothetical protein
MQAIAGSSELLLPEIEVTNSNVGSIEQVANLIKNEEVVTAIQTILNHFADTITTRILTHLGVVTSLVVPVAKSEVKPTVELKKSSSRSDEQRQRMSEAQKARWAAKQHKEAPVSMEVPPSPVPSTKKWTVGPEGRKRMAEAQKLRWAVRKRQQADNGGSLPFSTPREASTSTEADCQLQHNNSVKETTKEATLAVREGYTGDPFYISEDGHYIGNDGFVVPKDFTEFTERYPHYLETWVRRRLNGHGIEEDIEDWCQELTIHMKYLPPTSKHRALGKEDVIQTYDPFAQYGASERRWRYYINYILANKYNTIYGKREKNPVCRSGNMSLVGETNPDSHGEITDEYVYSQSEYLTDITYQIEKRKERVSLAHNFIEFVEEADPTVLPILQAMYEAGSATDTIREFCRTCNRLATTKEVKNGEHKGHEIGISQKEFNHARNRLKQLASSFKNNKKVRPEVVKTSKKLPKLNAVVRK